MAGKLSVQQVLQQHLEAYARAHPLDGQRLKVCRHLMHCHTPALGGMQYQCDHCAHPVSQYHSCRDRHCPQCQHRASRRWSEQQQQAILPVTYYHLVFTLPHELNGWARLHPKVIYTLLFQIAWQTLKAFAADPKRLGGQLGMTAVLHTWGQNLSQHVHLHCLIPGGVLTEAHQWKAARSHYLFPVRALSRHFRGRMVSQAEIVENRTSQIGEKGTFGIGVDTGYRPRSRHQADSSASFSAAVSTTAANLSAADQPAGV